MATLESRLAALEQTQKKPQRPLILFCVLEQNGEPPAEHLEKIAQAEKQGRAVSTISFQIV